jgi:hypothetical protein
MIDLAKHAAGVTVGIIGLLIRFYYPDYFPAYFMVVSSFVTCLAGYLTICSWRANAVAGTDREARLITILLLAATLACAYCAYLSFHLPVPRHV